MTGDASRQQVAEIPNALRAFIRHETEGLPTASFAVVRTLDEERQRVTVETYPDNVPIPNIPVATPFAADGTGDILPINPAETDQQVTGVVIYLHHDVERALDESNEPIPRGHAEESAVFIPAMVWNDTDAVPDHEPGERVISHPSGATVRMTDERLALEHPGGAEIELTATPDAETFELGEMMDAERDFESEEVYLDEALEEARDLTTWPSEEPGDATARIKHPSGAAITMTDDEIVVETDGHDLMVDEPTSGERRVLDGPFQHTQLLSHDDGEYSLVGDPLTFREFVAWLTDDELRNDLKNTGSGWVEDATIYAEAYLAWLEDVTGEAIDPTDADSWPDPEPMPPETTKEDFLP